MMHISLNFMILSDLSEGSTQLMRLTSTHPSYVNSYDLPNFDDEKHTRKLYIRKGEEETCSVCNDKVVDSNLQCNHLFCYDCAYKTWMMSTRMCPSCRLYLPNTFNEINCLFEKLKGVIKDAVFLKAQRPCANILILSSCIRSLRSVKWALNGYATFLSDL
ncbi:C3HC4-type RING zinc finger protein [Medicago truncatula]|uniref:C3HC4-type RING zinc finger protein n=1 Tax=Medicago truncatula TaxID=3880 RepID=G7KTH0_MEDTR|nr:C3HC4-type RING zinc finger protein [Medicago truncatula]